jgi:hypothetical protein
MQKKGIDSSVWEIECNCYKGWEIDEHMSIVD